MLAHHRKGKRCELPHYPCEPVDELVAEAGFVWWADPLNSDNPYTVESNGRKVVVVHYNVPGCNDYSKFIRYAKGFSNVWFARRLETANWCLEKGY